jgi:hypothetical protein
MKTPRLPAAAIWLLGAFKVTENNPELTGDLTEECSSGRSSAWLWRQVLAAIAFAIGKEIYSHKLLTIRAVVVGQLGVWLGVWVLAKVLYSHLWKVFWLTVFAHERWFHWNGWILFLPQWLIAFACGGWIVARFHRNHQRVLVLLFAMLQSIVLMVGEFPTLRRHLLDSVDQPRFRPYLEADVAVFLLSPIAVLLGGYLARRRAGVQIAGNF